MNKFLILLFLTANFALGQDPIYHHPNKDLNIGRQYVLFGDDVKFRETPNVESKVLSLLKIGSEIEVLKKADEIMMYNGIESHFYKVKYDGKNGYVLGGLISLEKKEGEYGTYLFQFKKKEFQYDIVVRAVNKDQTFTETSAPIGDPELSILLLDNKGLTSVQQILRIENHPEACGVIGGDIYLFQTENGLKKAFETTIFSEAGVNWYNEKLLFPTDKAGVANRIVYQKEQGEYGDEATNEVHVSTTSRELRWKNGELLPKIAADDR